MKSNKMKINEFARVCSCKVHTLRYYDEIGLLKPHYVDNISGYRYYDYDQLSDYRDIKEFQEIGFSIKEIRKLKNKDNHEIVGEILKKIDELSCKLSKANKLIEKYEGKGK